MALSASSASTRRARSEKPSAISPNELKNSDRSRSRSTPVARLSTENTRPVPRPTMPRPIRPEARKNCRERESMKRASRRGRLQEVQRVAAGRGVQHQQVVAPLLVQLVELLHRHVLLRAGHRVGELLVDRVGQHRVARGLVGRVGVHELVEGALGVEHHRPQLAGAGEGVELHPGLLVAQLGQPQRVGQPAGGVDGEHRRLHSALGHAQGDRGRGGGLAHPARAGADHHALSPDQLLDRSVTACARSRPPATSSPSRPELRGGHEGEGQHGGVHAPAQPGDLRALALGALVGAQCGVHGRARCGPGTLARGGERLGLTRGPGARAAPR